MTSASRGRRDPLSKQVDHQVGRMNDVLAIPADRYFLSEA
jgi:hypothetical protein